MKLAYWLFIGYILTVGIIPGCGGDSDSGSNIEEFVKKTKSMPKQTLKSLPNTDFKVDSTYSGVSKRSPFESSDEFQKDQDSKTSAIKEPDMNRPKEILEGFNLNELTMVGFLRKNDGSSWALISDNSGKVYKITIGNYIGQHYGRVKKIDERSTEVQEALPNDSGGWVSNIVTINLKE